MLFDEENYVVYTKGEVRMDGLRQVLRRPAPSLLCPSPPDDTCTAGVSLSGTWLPDKTWPKTHKNATSSQPAWGVSSEQRDMQTGAVEGDLGRLPDRRRRVWEPAHEWMKEHCRPSSGVRTTAEAIPPELRGGAEPVTATAGT